MKWCMMFLDEKKSKNIKLRKYLLPTGIHEEPVNQSISYEENNTYRNSTHRLGKYLDL